MAMPNTINAAPIGTYIMFQQHMKHQSSAVTAAVVADIVCTLLSIGKARKLGATPTKQINAHVRNERNLKCSLQSPKELHTSIHAGISNNATAHI